MTNLSLSLIHLWHTTTLAVVKYSQTVIPAFFQETMLPAATPVQEVGEFLDYLMDCDPLAISLAYNPRYPFLIMAHRPLGDCGGDGE